LNFFGLLCLEEASSEIAGIEINVPGKFGEVDGQTSLLSLLSLRASLSISV
jgi:hypothetical protein